MAVDTSLTNLLSTLTSSIDAAVSAVPEPESLLTPKDGISLLDTKNELLLSYLQNLVFLIVLKLRDWSNEDGTSEENLENQVVKKLIELRVFLERGVKPLEARLKYQIDKVLRAAEDAARDAARKSETTNGVSQHPDSGSESGNESHADGADAPVSEANIDELAFRPNPSSFKRQVSDAVATQETIPSDGIYRPPRIMPTALPTSVAPADREARAPRKSAVLDEFVASELSTTPMAEPSIGSTIVAGGRRSKSERERADEEERRQYEESNFVRLPKESKADRKKKGGRRERMGFGGEDWRGLGEGLDRIDRLTKKKAGTGGFLERSRKRKADGGDGGDRMSMGESFEKRKRNRANRTRG